MKSRNFFAQQSQAELIAVLCEFMPRKNDKKQCIEFCDDIGEIKGVLNYSKINSTFWGAFFERYVGLNFEELGFDVEYRGIKKTYFDGGVISCVENTMSL